MLYRCSKYSSSALDSTGQKAWGGRTVKDEQEGARGQVDTGEL
jgi:hypothetical protein